MSMGEGKLSRSGHEESLRISAEYRAGFREGERRAAAEIERLSAHAAKLESDNRRLWNALRSLKEFTYKLGEAVTGECEP